jgi:uncharacterized protein (TIGR03086 family)
MTASSDSVRVLSVALDQAGDVVARVRPDDLDRPTSCTDWSVGQLVDHLVRDLANFLAQMRGEQADWSATPGSPPDDFVSIFRTGADDLVHAWHQAGDDVPANPGAQIPEFAVHTWDLATAIGVPTDTLDAEVAERALEFMAANLTPDNRGAMFAAELEAASDAGPYERLAAFAGRTARS